MLLRTFLNLLPLVAAATAVSSEGGYLVPKDLAPGFYHVNFHANGTSTVEKLDPTAVVPRDTNAAEKRDLRISGSAKFARALAKRFAYGDSGRFMIEQDQYNTLTARWRSYFSLGNAASPGITFYITDRLVLASCNYGRNNQFMPPESVDEFNGVLDQNFGLWHTGWVHWGDVYGDITFWRDYRGIRLCSNLNGGWVP